MTTQPNAASREAREQRAWAILAETLGLNPSQRVAFQDGNLIPIVFPSDAVQAMLALADEAASQPREGVEQFDPVVFGCRVIAAMGGRSCRDVAEETGVSPATVNRVSRGGMPDVPTYLALSRWLAALPDTTPTDQGQGGGERGVEPDLQLFEQVASGQVDPRYMQNSLAGAVKRIRAALAQSGKAGA